MNNPTYRQSLESNSSAALLSTSDKYFNDAESNTEIETDNSTSILRKILHPLRTNKLLYIIYQTIIILFALIGVTNVIQYAQGKVDSRKFSVSYDEKYTATYVNEPCDCGWSVAEALSLGCVYDELSTAWLPKRCRDDELVAEFSRIGDGPNGTWMYYSDENRTHPLTVYETSLYADIQPARYYMSHEWHVHHCLYMWLKEHRFKVNGKYFDPRFDSDSHIRHCMMMITHVVKASTETSAGASLIG